MKRFLNQTSIRTLMLLLWAALALALTMLPKSVPLVGLVSRSLGRTALGAAIGHAGLFGGVAFTLYFVLRLKIKHATALIIAVGVALALGTGTELYQVLLADRDTSLVDFLANWLGVFVVGFCASYAGYLKER